MGSSDPLHKIVGLLVPDDVVGGWVGVGGGGWVVAVPC